jgi:hypothetical protein
VPFIAAYGAGDDVWNEGVDHMAAMLAWIAESAATEDATAQRRPPFRKARRMIADIASAPKMTDELLARLEELRYPTPW